MMINVLRQAGQSSHDVILDGKGDTSVASFCLCPAASEEGIAGSHLLQLTLLGQSGLAESSNQASSQTTSADLRSTSCQEGADQRSGSRGKPNKSGLETFKTGISKKRLATLKEHLLKLQVQATDRDENKDIVRSTSNLNYLDPGITIARVMITWPPGSPTLESENVYACVLPERLNALAKPSQHQIWIGNIALGSVNNDSSDSRLSPTRENFGVIGLECVAGFLRTSRDLRVDVIPRTAAALLAIRIRSSLPISST
ncbi:unnamed protein product [Schistocephalus solidus]|uniref:Topo_C_assoc domain-containing protein n=1 Tax=Schistocephalus solidus TaxID=70667 RepID=A0A183SRV6_SCHSO|nr:unnamed protein product [Schistocephalus solidus]